MANRVKIELLENIKLGDKNLKKGTKLKAWYSCNLKRNEYHVYFNDVKYRIPTHFFKVIHD